MFTIRLTALRHQTSKESETQNENEEEEEETSSGLKTIILDEYKLEPFEHASVINVVRLFDERYASKIETNEKL